MEYKEQWANDVFSSIEGMKRATPSNEVFGKIKEQLQNSVQIKIIPLSKLAWVAVAACFIIMVNIFAITTNYKNGNHSISSQDQILNDLILYK